MQINKILVNLKVRYDKRKYNYKENYYIVLEYMIGIGCSFQNVDVGFD